jgi:uncharacterized coiled-coil DUF342 family protein
MDYSQLEDWYCRLSKVICELDEISEDICCYSEELDGRELRKISDEVGVFQENIDKILKKCEEVDDEPDWYHDRLQEKLDSGEWL